MRNVKVMATEQLLIDLNTEVMKLSFIHNDEWNFQNEKLNSYNSILSELFERMRNQTIINIL